MSYNQNTDFRTSKGNVAPDLHWSGKDDAYEARAQLRKIVERDYSPARVVRPSTRKYNCHAFAHAGSHAWFNEIQKFLEDDYYPFTPGQLLIDDIVVYVKNGSITHSAKIISLSGNVITQLRSKWGAWPEVEHGERNVPAEYGNIVYYLRRRGRRLWGEAVDEDEIIGNGISDLISRLQDGPLIDELLRASTPQAAADMLLGDADVIGLTLYSGLAVGAIREALQEEAAPATPVLPLFAALVGSGSSLAREALAEVATQVAFRTESASFEDMVLLRLIQIAASRMEPLSEDAMKSEFSHAVEKLRRI